MDLEVKDSKVQGRGVFATRDFKENETICIFEGRRVSLSELRTKFKAGRSDVSCNAFQIGEREYLFIENPYVYVNHFCTPNAIFKNESELVALVPIQKGKEIFFDYSTTEWTPQEYTEYDHSEWPMRCRCGSASCRKLVTCFPYLPKEIQDAYLQKGLQDYIREKSARPFELQRCYVCEEALKHSDLAPA